MVINTQDTNYSIRGMVINIQDTNYYIGGMVINTNVSVNYHPSNGVISVLSVNYHIKSHLYILSAENNFPPVASAIAEGTQYAAENFNLSIQSENEIFFIL